MQAQYPIFYPSMFPNLKPPELTKGISTYSISQPKKNNITDQSSKNGDKKTLVETNPPERIEASAYKRRNVYKSIIRHMASYIKKNKGDLIDMLIKLSFSRDEIETAFMTINEKSELEKSKGKLKGTQKTLNKFSESKSIYAYILKESLEIMIEALKKENKRKITKKNINIYKEVCKEYLKRCYECTLPN